MKIINKIKFLVVLSLLSSCNYLDVIPPEQADVDDTMNTAESTLRFLYSCYSVVSDNTVNSLQPSQLGATADDIILSQEYGGVSSLAQYGTISPTINEQSKFLKKLYDGIGQCNHFLQLISQLNPPILESEKAQYIAEVKFLKAFYHFRLLEFFGPIPIVDEFLPADISTDKMPGRSHFDYCVEYIVKLLDEAYKDLPKPEELVESYQGRATTVIAKAVKARVLLFAASPLWNGSFPYPSWKNENFETPGYGKELVSKDYNQQKWEKAYDAYKDAIAEAEGANYKLFDLDASEQLRNSSGLKLPKIPGLDSNSTDEKVLEFRERVMMFRYLNCTKTTEGNQELIWTARNSPETIWFSLPYYVILGWNGENRGGQGCAAPTLYAVEHFYTKNGMIPAEDPTFTQEANWLKPANKSFVASDIINLHVDREPRFYAWITFDGDEFSPYIQGGNPLIMHMRDPQENGYNPSKQGSGYSATGYLSKKWIGPNMIVNKGNTNVDLFVNMPKGIIRLAELYLGFAECAAVLGDNARRSEAVTYLNKIRTRAGVPNVKVSDFSNTNGPDLRNNTLLKKVLEERFIEFFEEGQRYLDVRRWVLGKERMSAQCYEGLNAMIEKPTVTEFNQRTKINQPFSWHDRAYLLPIPSFDIYSNSQMVQAPGY